MNRLAHLDCCLITDPPLILSSRFGINCALEELSGFGQGCLFFHIRALTRSAAGVLWWAVPSFDESLFSIFSLLSPKYQEGPVHFWLKTLKPSSIQILFKVSDMEDMGPLTLFYILTDRGKT